MTVTITNPGDGATGVGLVLTGTDPRVLVSRTTEPACVSGSGPTLAAAPPEPTANVFLELAGGGTLTYEFEVEASTWERRVDRARMRDWHGSGALCEERTLPAARGVYDLEPRIAIRGRPTPLKLTVR